jgi:rubredoxin
MSTVYVVQELRKFVCPECEHWRLNKQGSSYTCEACNHEFERAKTVPKHDLTPASAFGDLQILINRNQIGIAAQPIVAQLRHDLRDYSDDDYVLAVGDPVAIGLAISVAADSNRGRVNILKWDRQTRQYISLSANIREYTT